MQQKEQKNRIMLEAQKDNIYDKEVKNNEIKPTRKQ